MMAETPPDPDFRVLSFRRQPEQVTARCYRKRTTHHKSKTGCLACKAKRVKVSTAGAVPTPRQH